MTYRWRTGIFGGGLALLCAGSAFAAAPPGGTGCTKTAILDAGGSSAVTSKGIEISANPIRICSVSLVASYATNAWGYVYQSPETTNPAHAQAVVKAEPGVAAQFDTASEFFGDVGILTYAGTGAYVMKGVMIVQYQD
jgi:hypothetical protein